MGPNLSYCWVTEGKKFERVSTLVRVRVGVWFRLGDRGGASHTMVRLEELVHFRQNQDPRGMTMMP